MKKILLIAGIFFLAAAPALSAGYRKPKNPRQRPRPRPAAPASAGIEASTGTISVERAAFTADAPQKPRLKRGLRPGRWSPQVKAAIEEVLVEYGRLSARYDEQAPPLAVLAWLGVCSKEDPAEQLFLRLVSQAAFKFDDDFWKIVPIAYGRQRLRAALEEFSQTPRQSWESQPAFHQFRKGFLKGYRQMCEKIGVKDCRLYLAKLLRGYPENEIAAVAAASAEGEAGRFEPGVDEIKEWPEDPFPIRVRQGLAAVPEAKDLVELLLAEGFEVWIADLQPQPVLEAAAKVLGFEGAKLAGIRQGSYREKLTGLIVEPVPWRGGKVELVAARTRRVPVLVFAAGLEDAPLLTHGEGVRVLLDSGDPQLRGQARSQGWLLQPPF